MSGFTIPGMVTDVSQLAQQPSQQQAQPAQAAPAPITLPVQQPTATVVSASAGVISFGQKVESVYVPRFKGVKGYTRRIAIVNPSRIFVATTHYHQTLKAFHCFNGSCCRADNPKQNYLIPVQVYDTNKDGQVISPKVQCEYLQCPSGQWELLTMIHASTPIDTIDLGVICEDDKYQKLKIAPAGPAMWRQNAQWAAQVVAEVNGKADRILRSAGRYLAKLPDNREDVEAMNAYRSACEAALSKANSETVEAAPAAQVAAPAFDVSKFLASPAK